MSKKRSKKNNKRNKIKRVAYRKQAAGDKFEDRMEAFMNDYFNHHGIEGVAYRIPVTHDAPQHIDLLIDSKIMGYVGIECKSVFEDKLKNGKLYFNHIANVNKSGESQITRQHDFIESTGRYGIIAFEMRCMDRVFLLPHRYIYDRISNGYEYMTISEIVRYGFLIEREDCFSGDIVSFVRNKCW